MYMSENALGKADSEYESDANNSVEHKCPTCGDEFGSDRGVKIHHTMIHGESIAKETLICEWCSEPFERYKGDIRDGQSQCCSNECKYALLSERVSGKSHPRYTGEYEKRQSKYWNGVRKEIRDRDDYECQECGTPESKLNRELDVHHKIPWTNFDEPKDADYSENLVSLCASCHAKIEWERETQS
jgi:5-methylcytosine-specific restriction endonuclease McrA